MKESPSDLPPEIAARLLACVEQIGDEVKVRDSDGLFNLVREYGDKYPILESLLKVDEEAIQRHIEETGEPPPGIEAVCTTVEEGSNVIHVQILRAPRSKESNE